MSAISPRLLQGALVTQPARGPASTIAFQYNPETLTRRLQPRVLGGGEGRGDQAIRLSGPPKETIQLTVELDATDALERGDGSAIANGIQPDLAALELLLYPPASHVDELERRASAGELEIIPPEAPVTLLRWDSHRSIPVRVTEMAIVEEAHDPQLNPIRAKIDLTLEVLSHADVGMRSPIHGHFMSFQRTKESLARGRPGPSTR